MIEAAERADQLLDEGDMASAETWHRILNAIERLQAKAPASLPPPAVLRLSHGPRHRSHGCFRKNVNLAPLL